MKFDPCMAVGENVLGTLVYVQACQCDSTAHAQNFSHPKGKADDHDIIT